jgi:anti-sigma factor RsiW
MPPSLICPDQAQLARLLEGELSETEQTELTSHLDGCPRSQQAVQELAYGGRTWTDVAAHLQREHARNEKEPALRQAVDALVGPARTDETQTEPGAGFARSVLQGTSTTSPPDRVASAGKIPSAE